MSRRRKWEGGRELRTLQNEGKEPRTGSSEAMTDDLTKPGMPVYTVCAHVFTSLCVHACTSMCVHVCFYKSEHPGLGVHLILYNFV